MPPTKHGATGDASELATALGDVAAHPPVSVAGNTVRNTARNTARTTPPDAARSTPPSTGIWRSEAEWFDARAAAADARASAGVPREVLERYANPTRPWYNKQYRFRLLGRLDGVRVLDVGCGMGENAVLLASRGALVTGVDVSPRSIEVARRLAASTPTRVKPEFLCSPLETAELAEGSFDVIWGDGFLHHVLHDLEGVLERCLRFGRDGALVVFSEPVDRLPGLRRLRALLPIEPDGTPNERPLLPRELEIVRRHVPDVRVEAFSFLGRLDRLILPGRSLERASPVRRALSDLLNRADATLLRAPGLSRLGGMLVLVGHVARRAQRSR